MLSVPVVQRVSILLMLMGASHVPRALAADSITAHKVDGRGLQSATAIDLGPLGKAYRETLSNGVVLIVRPNASSNVVGMDVASRVGTRYEGVGQSGLATLTLKMAMQGAGNQDADAIQGWFEDRGASLLVRAHPDYSEIGSAIAAPDFPGMADRIANHAIHTRAGRGPRGPVKIGHRIQGELAGRRSPLHCRICQSAAHAQR